MAKLISETGRVIKPIPSCLIGPVSRVESERQAGKERRRRLRSEVIAAYGGRCACCGETTPEFLSVDHMNNDGAQHRKHVKSGQFYPWLKRNGFPKDGFQLLCMNCNSAKGFFGECPHQRAKGGAA